jgi:hypothetical protein
VALGLDLSATFAKIDRAVDLCDLLERDVPAAFKENGPYAVRFTTVDPNTGWCDVVLVPEPEKPRFGVLVGDVMHNLRCALNYIVTALVDASRVPLTRSHQFPIYLDPAKYARVVGTPARAQKGGPLHGIVHGLGLIEQVQPYKLQPDPRYDYLWHVHRFNNADKHREIATLLAVPSGAMPIRYNGTLVEKDEGIEITDWEPDKEMVIGRLRFDPPVATNLRVDGPVTVSYAFSIPPFDGEPVHSIVGPLVRQSCAYVRQVAESFKLL